TLACSTCFFTAMPVSVRVVVANVKALRYGSLYIDNWGQLSARLFTSITEDSYQHGCLLR
ncbi:MAG: hypothetical protein PHE19_03475, partial [Candidatus Cloacimonetes bacterium]|nr:hypothetical protein [Candidatus Cloacimonadota bacterium]